MTSLSDRIDAVVFTEVIASYDNPEAVDKLIRILDEGRRLQDFKTSNVIFMFKLKKRADGTIRNGWF